MMQKNNYNWNQFDSHDLLAEQLATAIERQLADAIEQRGVAVMALSGGSTPKPLFERLVDVNVDWSRVVVTLVDERWVPESHALSNAAFLKKYLLNLLPVKPTFAPLYYNAATVKDSLLNVFDGFLQACHSEKALVTFDVVVLGMGGDGHTASFFPDARNITDLVNANASEPLLSCSSASTQVERVTWSVSRLLDTHFLALHFTGVSKREVFDRGLGEGEVTELPIRAMIRQQQVPLTVFYAD